MVVMFLQVDLSAMRGMGSTRWQTIIGSQKLYRRKVREGQNNMEAGFHPGAEAASRSLEGATIL